MYYIKALMPTKTPSHQSTSHLLTGTAPAVLEEEVAVPSGEEVSLSPGFAMSVISASKPVLGVVTVTAVLVTVALTAVPLELTTMIVCPAALVVINTAVAPSPVPTVVDNPGVSVKVAPSRVIASPIGRGEPPLSEVACEASNPDALP